MTESAAVAEPFLRVSGLARYFDVSPPLLNRLLERRERLLQIDGAMPPLSAIPAGCAFHPRCPEAFARCRGERPELLPAGASAAACWLQAGTPHGRAHG